MADGGTGRLVPARVTAVVEHDDTLVSGAAAARDGRFRIGDLPWAPVGVVAWADGFAPQFETFSPGLASRRSLDLRLLLGGAARGVVVDAGGRPVSGAYVHVGYAPSLAGAEFLSGLAGGSPITDEQGAFALTGLVPGRPAALRATLADGRVSAVVTIQVEPGFAVDGIALPVR